MVWALVRVCALVPVLGYVSIMAYGIFHDLVWARVWAHPFIPLLGLASIDPMVLVTHWYEHQYEQSCLYGCSAWLLLFGGGAGVLLYERLYERLRSYHYSPSLLLICPAWSVAGKNTVTTACGQTTAGLQFWKARNAPKFPSFFWVTCNVKSRNETEKIIHGNSPN